MTLPASAPMQLPRTPLFLVWYAAVLIAALYLVARLFLVGDYARTDYAIMLFVHGSLVVQYAVGGVRYRREEADA